MFVLVRVSRVRRNALCWTHTHTFTSSHTNAFKLTPKYQPQHQRSVDEFLKTQRGCDRQLAFSNRKDCSVGFSSSFLFSSGPDH